MDPYEIILEGTFGWEITLEGFMEALRGANGDDLLIKMSSSGGSVQVSTGIKNAIESYMASNGAKVTFDVIGWAQSAGSYTMMIQGATRIVHANTLWMHHNPMDCVCGDHVAMAKKADILSRLTTTYAQAYSQISGKAETDVLTEMDAETFLVGQEIVDAGFADEIVDSQGIEPAASGKDGLVRIGRQNIKKVSQVLQAAAFGETPQAPAIKPPKEEPTQMAIEKTDEKVLQAATERAKAFAAAMSAMPERNEQLLAAFEAGKPAEYFEGMTALSTEMKADAEAKAEAAEAKKKLELAGKKPGEGGDGVEPVMTGNVPVKTENKTTPGASGATVEV
jgi:ATP-dependent protease ClpP protease subunit